MTSASELSEFMMRLRGQVADTAIGESEGTDDVGVVSFREDAYVSTVLEILEEQGQVSDPAVCFFERKVGRGIGRLNGWHCDPENSLVTLVTAVFRGLEVPSRVAKAEIIRAIERAVRVFSAARRGYHERMEPASEQFDMMERLFQVSQHEPRLRVVVLVDGISSSGDDALNVDLDVETQVDVWDARRLCRLESSGLPYEPIEIDLVSVLGRALPCLASPELGGEFEVYLAIVPGDLIHALYHEYGPRLLELNVRSFLQARGKVNRGIRNTLRTEPSRFLAYNNGLSATAEWVDVARDDGGLVLKRVRGLQIVNGGQTVASIHQAKARDRRDLSEVFVQAKLTIVSPEDVQSLVPQISRYANTQNRVNEADFSANHPFHVKLQQLSQVIWAPGEQSRWFYERARGQYHVAQQREGRTVARMRRFKQANPPKQRMDKVRVAKYANAWHQLPHVVGRGSQKNFLAFMSSLKKTYASDWLPDADYYRELVSKAIIFKSAESIARKLKFSGYRANVVAYTVALLSYRTAGRIDLSLVWLRQGVSPALERTLTKWMPRVHAELVESAGQRNVTEWCKKEDCWRHIQTLPVELPSALEAELAEGMRLPTVGKHAQDENVLTPQDRENIARVLQVGPETWLHLAGWCAASDSVRDWYSELAASLAGYAVRGWNEVPSHKQAKHAVRLLKQAEELGGMPPVDD